METPYLAPLGLFFLLWISDEEENMKFVEDHPMKIPIKFGSNWPSGHSNSITCMQLQGTILWV
jgi:hypothetical protein